MLLRKALGSLTAAAIILAPTAAAAQQAPLPAPTIETGAQLGDDDDFPLIWIFAAGGIAILIYFLLIKGDDDDEEEEEEIPTSP